MRTFAVVFAILFAAVAAQAQLSRGECMGRCVLCGDDPVCATIYENCIHTCMTNGKKAPPPLPDVWGAIAVSPSALVQGHSWNYKSEEEARQRALKECAASTVAKDCKVVVTVADVCVALAISKPERIYTIGGPIGAANYADGGAKLKCERAGGHSCRIETSFCADGIRHITGRDTQQQPAGRRKE